MKFPSYIRKIFWPIERNEYAKFIPMAMIMFCILFNYSTLRSLKDSFVVTSIGSEALGFLKTYFVLPSALIAMVCYAKLCNICSAKNVFYIITSFFIAYFALFTFVLQPYLEFFNLNIDTVSTIASEFPRLKWFIKIAGHWPIASFYVMSELWGGMMVSLLFWQLANQITTTEEAKRFYSMFGLFGNFGLLFTAFVLNWFLQESTFFSSQFKFVPVLSLTIISALCVIYLYHWLDSRGLTASTQKSSKKSKPKLSIVESFKLISTSKYLGLIAMLVLCYGISINLVEGVWKTKIRELYPSKEQYSIFMGQFQAWQGIGAIIFMVIGSNILRKLSWFKAAILTPIMILLTGGIFFAVILADKHIADYVDAIFHASPLMFAVVLGMIQNVLSKSTKYSLFDSTKEMAYIPIDNELKTKGKAAVDVIGGRMGKSGGGIIQSTFFMLLPTFTFDQATPYFSAVFFIIVILWIYSVKVLNKEYHNQLVNHEY